MSTNTMSKPTETSSKKLFTKEWLIEQKSLIALLFLIVVVSFLNPNFFTVDNILNILRQTSVNAIIAVGMTLVILTAGIDLSVGSVLALCGAFAREPNRDGSASFNCGSNGSIRWGSTGRNQWHHHR